MSFVGCAATIQLLVTNATSNPLSVGFAEQSAIIYQSETETLIVPAIHLPLTIEVGEKCSAFQLPLEQLPGEYYKPGFRHSVQVNVIGLQEIRIYPVDSNKLEPISISAIECDEAVTGHRD